MTDKLPAKRKRVSHDPSVYDSGANVSTAASTSASKNAEKKLPLATKTLKTKVKGKSKQTSVAKINIENVIKSWPPRFKEVERTHRALNVVYTFCSTRKQLATTFETMKKAVEGHIGRELKVEDVAEVVAIRPQAARFGWVDELTLLADIRGGERDEGFDSRGKDELVPPPAESVGGGIISGEGHGHQLSGKRSEVLLFEFVDGDLKREVYNPRTGETEKPKKMLRNEELKVPVYSQKQVVKVIERRNGKFVDAVVAFLQRCEEETLDPETRLVEEAKKWFPTPTPMPTPTEAEEVGAEGHGKGDSSLPRTIPKKRAAIPEIIQQLKASPWYTNQIVPNGHKVFEPQVAVTGNLNFLMSQDLVNALYNGRGISQFYAHQAEAINALHDGYHVVVSTSTSSGKSLIYQLPVLHELEKDRLTRALYVFPTKALAQDQRRGLKEMLAYMPGLEDVMVETFDGDTDLLDRDTIRECGRVVLTNPDMLHVTILPREEEWRGFFQHLRFVVVDELHYYNSLMGAHMGYIMRRLRRVCAAVGNNNIKFISCSATVANPLQHFTTLFGLSKDEVRLVEFDGSPSGGKEFLCWNTPFKDASDPARGRADSMYECARLFCQLILRGVRTIAFCRIRVQCEQLLVGVKKELADLGRGECANLVVGYRGGYTAQDRRFIEKEMFEGKLVGIVATTALELGVDIGTLDAVITWGFPYSISNLRQQSGRAGRRNKDSLSVLVGGSLPTDQYFMQNPDKIFTRPSEELSVDLSNVMVAEGHLQCAAYEMPIHPESDIKYFGPETVHLKQLCKDRLVGDHLGYFHTHSRFRPTPSKFVNIRNMEEDENVAIVDISNGRNIVLEELEKSRATLSLYDGAIHLHQGQKYLVRDWNPEKRIAQVERVMVDWTTVQRSFTDIEPIETEESRRLDLATEQEFNHGNLDKPHINSHNSLLAVDNHQKHQPKNPHHPATRAYRGKIRITKTILGFFKLSSTNQILDAISTSNPIITQHSKGIWLDLPKHSLVLLERRNIKLVSAIHSASHAILNLFPLYLSGLVPGDVRTICTTSSQQQAEPDGAEGKERRKRRRDGMMARLAFYDAHGGMGGTGGTTGGISARAFEFIDVLLPKALHRIESCLCEKGCLECVCDETCKAGEETMSKVGAVVVLRSLLGWEVGVDVVSPPDGGELCGFGSRVENRE